MVPRLVSGSLRRLRALRPPRRLTRRHAVLALVFLLAGLTVAGLAKVRIDTGISSFLPSGDPAYQAIEDKARSFGGDPVVVLLESHQPREFVTDQEQLFRLLRLEGELAHLPDVAAVYGPATALNQAAGTAQNVLAEISGRRDGLRNTAVQQAKQHGASDAAAHSAGDKAVADFDHRYGALLVRGLPAGLPTLRNEHFVQTVVFGDDGRPRPQWHYVLPDDSTVAVLVRPRENIDQAAAGRLADSIRSTVAGSGLSPRKVTVTGVPVITSALTRHAQWELPILGAVSVAAVGAVFLLVPWSRRRRSRLRPLLASLLGAAATVALFGWIGHPLSLGVVAFLPILLGIGSDFPFYLCRPGHPRRIVVAALAGVAGFAALGLSPLPFVRELGFALGLGIALTVGIAYAMREAFGVVEPVETVKTPGRRQSRSSPRLLRIAVAVVAVAVAGGGWFALPRLGIEAQPDQLARGLPELADAQYAEQVLGSAGEVGIVLHGRDVLTPDVLRWSMQAQSAVVRQHGDQVSPVLTVADLFRFLGPDATPDQVEAAANLMPHYLTSAVLRADRTEALLLFGVQLRDVGQLGQLLDQVRMSLPPTPSGIHADLVGLPTAAVRGLDLMSHGRMWMNLAGVAAAALILLAGLRNRGDALRAVATVLLSTGWVAALAWVITGSLNPLTLAVGSLTTATGCEFAIMLRRPGLWSARSVLRGVGTAAAAGTVGYLVLSLSHLAVLRDFGLLLAASVGCSFLAALAASWVTAPRADGIPAETAVAVSGSKVEREVTV